MPVSDCTLFLTEAMLNLYVMDDLSSVLNRELNRRGLSMRALARRAKVSVTTISNIISQQNDASADVCVKLARALDIDPSKFLRLAGHLKPLPPAAEDEAEVLHAYRRLSEQQRQVIRQALTGLVAQRVDEDTPQWSPPTPSPAALRETGPPQEEMQLEIPSGGEWADDGHHMDWGRPLREMLECYVSVPRTQEELDHWLDVALEVIQDALHKYQASKDETPPSEDDHREIPTYSQGIRETTTKRRS